MDHKAPKAVKLKKKLRAKLPRNPFGNIALSLSGGGFRATSMHLGVLSYLYSTYYNGITLLERVRILSTVSGGTFVGVKYAATIKRGGTFPDCYRFILDFMTRRDLVEEALQYLAEDSNWRNGRQRSLINSFASIYHKDYDSGHFGILWEEHPAIHLKEISFNATEFHFALPFHFQKTEYLHGEGDDHVPEFIGNRKLHIPVEVAKELRLADILAASSCVPFGFEPINFPDDFLHEESVLAKDRNQYPQVAVDGAKVDYPIGLMDGGVDDNQGVDAVLLAEERLKRYPDELREFSSLDKKAVDLYIISDGTNPTMTRYSRSKKDRIPYVGTWSFKLLQHFGVSSFVVGMTLFTMAFMVKQHLWVIALSMSGTLGIVMAFVFLIISRGFTGLTRRLGVPAFFLQRMIHVDKLKFATLNNLLVNRRNSAIKMITKVLIKQMRWFSFERVFSDKDWKPRLILNATFELNKEEVEQRKVKYPFYDAELLDPGEKIMSVSEKALRMETTLWFTTAQLKGENNAPSTIIACGQFTMCFNLLEYFEKFVYHPKYQKDYDKYSDETKEALRQLHTHLLEDWRKFKEDPYWMAKKFGELWT